MHGFSNFFVNFLKKGRYYFYHVLRKIIIKLSRMYTSFQVQSLADYLSENVIPGSRVEYSIAKAGTNLDMLAYDIETNAANFHLTLELKGNNLIKEISNPQMKANYDFSQFIKDCIMIEDVLKKHSGNIYTRFVEIKQQNIY